MKLKYRPTQTFIKDTGLVLVLVLLLIAYWRGSSLFILLSIGALVVVMTVPVILKPLAVIWYYFSVVLGNIMSRIVLAVIFWGVLMPVAIVRRWLGFDPMKQKIWKKGRGSVFKKRNHTFTCDDLNMPY